MSDTRAQRNRMSTDRWRRVQDLFAAALECDAADRPRLVGHACGDDEEMQREVESLLASHDNPGPLDRLASAVAPAAAWARTQVAGIKQASPVSFNLQSVGVKSGMIDEMRCPQHH